jgi:hypothetical protein
LDANDAATDKDSDGLDNLAEFQLGADPNNEDTDGDGLSDGEEVNIYNTNPVHADTDRDKIRDGEEVANNTNPALSVDVDLDGMPDDWETIRGTNPGVLDARIDGDGVDNVVELLRNTLPLDANSLPTIQTIYIDVANLYGRGIFG